MDYDKLTKAELIEELKRFRHLSTTVQSKDAQIASLIKEVDEMKASKESFENKKLQEAVEINKDLVDENRELVSDLRYLIQVFNGFLGNFQSNAQLTQILLKKYLNGGQ
jgi:predicted RNase H-like nuclease (RuvC/YqgF family)